MEVTEAITPTIIAIPEAEVLKYLRKIPVALRKFVEEKKEHIDPEFGRYLVDLASALEKGLGDVKDEGNKIKAIHLGTSFVHPEFGHPFYLTHSPFDLLSPHESEEGIHVMLYGRDEESGVSIYRGQFISGRNNVLLFSREEAPFDDDRTQTQVIYRLLHFAENESGELVFKGLSSYTTGVKEGPPSGGGKLQGLVIPNREFGYLYVHLSSQGAAIFPKHNELIVSPRFEPPKPKSKPDEVLHI